MKNDIETREDWFETVDTYWDTLYDILARFVPKEQLKEADNLRLQQDVKLENLFQTAWSNAPDNKSIHSIPGWGVLCELCSESYVLFDEGDQSLEEFVMSRMGEDANENEDDGV